jgi:hypothetical protein
VAVTAAPVAEAELEGLMARIDADAAALRRFGIVVLRVALKTERNKIEVGISTEREDGGGVLVSMYGPVVEVTVIDPTGAFLKPKGTVIATVRDGQGEAVSACVYAEPLFAELDRDAVGCEPEPSGVVRLSEVPGRWRLTTQAEGYAPESVEIDIPPGGTVRTEIVVEPLQ